MAKKKPNLATADKETTQAYVSQVRKEAAIEAQNEAFNELSTELSVAYDSHDRAEATAWNGLTKAELESEWEQLRRLAKVEFPEGKNYFGLSPNNRLAAIAKCLGWSTKKISKASGININTLYDWFKRPDINVFMDDFNMKTGVKDPDKLVTANAVKGLKVINRILEDKDSSEATKRLQFQAASFAIERKWGKANQPVEHDVGGVKELLDALKNVETIKITPEEEKEIFAKDEVSVH